MQIKENTTIRRCCLNPCFSGGWSRRYLIVGSDVENKSLNPCFSGGWSRRWCSWDNLERQYVSLNPCFSGGWSRRKPQPRGTQRL